MSSLHSTTDLTNARLELEWRQRAAYEQIGRKVPDPNRDEDRTLARERLKAYLASNPDITPSQLAETLSEADQASVPLPNVVDLSAPVSESILRERVIELQRTILKMGHGPKFERICFGTVPGGGLDAYSFKIENSQGYGVIIPEGFFHLLNLFSKIVVQLQPITASPNGPIFLPSASFAQFELMSRPHVVFRHRDLLEAFFFFGDPKAALPYRQALPYQDRFVYLLVGAEIFLLAHEVAHVLLGHLDDSPGANESTPDKEIAADNLAVEIVTEFFRSEMNYPVARASLCAVFFLSIVKVWERGISLIVADQKAAQSHTHPMFEARFQSFVDKLNTLPEEETPGWYLMTHNAIRMATELMSEAVLTDIASKADGGSSVSSRVLPPGYAHLGHLSDYTVERWWTRLAGLLLDNDAANRNLGLWLFCQNAPDAAIGFYKGLLSDDDDAQRQFERALVSLQPMYESYIPRLKERFRETAQQAQFDEYLLNLSIYLVAMAEHELKAGGDGKEYQDATLFYGARLGSHGS